jgi:hypothetical protein
VRGILSNNLPKATQLKNGRVKIQPNKAGSKVPASQ